MEDKIRKQDQAIMDRELSIKMAKEEKARFEEEIKQIRLEQQKTKSKLENLINSKIPTEQLKTMVNQENEVMIRNLKENLEKTRDEKQELIDQIYKLQQENQ